MSKRNEQFGKIGVLLGGYSSERSISLKSGKAVYEALLSEGCDVVSIDIEERDEPKIKALIKESGIDVAFITLHGQLGEDGVIQKILEDLDLPFTGSGVEASRTAINKILTQRALKKNNLPIAEHVALQKGEADAIKKVLKQLKSFPVVVKPACEGSSIGVALVKNEKEFESALKTAFTYGSQVLVEKFIRGRELTVGILGQKALPVIEVCPKNNFFDFTAKYSQGQTDYIVPAKLPETLAAQLQEIALKTFEAIGCKDLARIDFMISDKNEPFVLEINTIPGFTATSLLPKAALVTGVSFNQLCLKLVELAYGKKTAKI